MSTAQKKKINLLPQGDLEKTQIGKVLQWGLSYGRYIIIFTELIVVICFLVRFKLDRNLNGITKEIEQKQATITSYEEFEDKFNSLREKVSSLNKLTVESKKTSPVFSKINQKMPLNVSLDKLILQSKEKKEIQIEGIALSTTGLRTLLTKLKESKNFNSIELTSLSSGGDKNPNLKFSLKVNYDYKNKQ